MSLKFLDNCAKPDYNGSMEQVTQSSKSHRLKSGTRSGSVKQSQQARQCVGTKLKAHTLHSLLGENSPKTPIEKTEKGKF